MRGSVAKVLRKLFLDGMSGHEERKSRKYNLVRHMDTPFGIPKGNFILLDCPRRHYQLAKHAYVESWRGDRRRMITSALAEIAARKARKAAPPEEVKPGEMVQPERPVMAI